MNHLARQTADESWDIYHFVTMELVVANLLNCSTYLGSNSQQEALRSSFSQITYLALLLWNLCVRIFGQLFYPFTGNWATLMVIMSNYIHVIGVQNSFLADFALVFVSCEMGQVYV